MESLELQYDLIITGCMMNSNQSQAALVNARSELKDNLERVKELRVKIKNLRLDAAAERALNRSARVAEREERKVARETLGLALGYFDEFEKEAQELFNQEITDVEFSKLIRSIYPKPDVDNKSTIKRWENKVVLIDDLYHNSPTNANIKGTKWGAFNALTERL